MNVLCIIAGSYADRRNAYWTGFFTSRPALKGYVRVLSGFYLVRFLARDWGNSSPPVLLS